MTKTQTKLPFFLQWVYQTLFPLLCVHIDNGSLQQTHLQCTFHLLTGTTNEQRLQTWGRGPNDDDVDYTGGHGGSMLSDSCPVWSAVCQTRPLSALAPWRSSLAAPLVVMTSGWSLTPAGWGKGRKRGGVKGIWFIYLIHDVESYNHNKYYIIKEIEHEGCEVHKRRQTVIFKVLFFLKNIDLSSY